MNTIHLIVGDVAGDALQKAIDSGDALQGSVMVLKDILNVGPLKSEEQMSFSDTRSKFWNTVMGEGHHPADVNDLERLMELSTTLSNDADLNIWYWMAPIPADITAYFWILHFLKKHSGRVSVVNISGLPFLDEGGKLFFPESFGYLPTKEIVKARKLARPLSPSEWETDGDEWKRLAAENEGLRLLEGGKKLAGRAISYYDDLLLGLATPQAQKANKLVNAAMAKNKIYTGDTFLHWRLRELAATNQVELQKGEVRLASQQRDESKTEEAGDTASA